MSKPIKVLIVDDSAVVRQVLTTIFSADPQLEVIGAAADPILAQEKMALEWPDVIVLDVEMPRMDGITFLKKIMAERPTRVLICSTLTENGAATTMQALAAGAVGYVTKPKLGLKTFLSDSAAELIRDVKQAALATPRDFGRVASPGVATARPVHSVPGLSMAESSNKIVAIGTSTGGTQALEILLTALPRVCAGIVIVQHMPEKFTALFAERLNGLCAIEVREARNGDRVSIGRALIAPGGMHMRLVRSGAFFAVEVFDGPPVNRHKPSVDVLFRSVATVSRDNAMGIIMTGMGDDGARGLREMHDAGAQTVAQDEASCVVFGMPKEAIRHGAVDRVVPLDRIASEVIGFRH
ncbi:chemotaxis response regulator protein-glutamate methylesterase [Herbaspirillum sp. RTI4]|uniref:protein-glutamate methylesterase/protein-glutamine glutaminase n=1 Tax=Herbaspirillum sp. RTI4 TaxID=3048640 RepID=UPI002AB35755|nr:chemotaxis response regulator protein-glutamate methylesterase [Herbaspirillum sp. RTI4]MDY7578091.1 chemotaxis response regulator protein-glutamate methylesterase [Herbaspirillum sp. RTI4]MEA9980680.1 chemotaxis response regulator protein-glutamate methylesterase [Herbaspirillum sp. RTI4]